VNDENRPPNNVTPWYASGPDVEDYIQNGRSLVQFVPPSTPSIYRDSTSQALTSSRAKRPYTKKDGVKYGRKAVTMDMIENPLKRKTCYDKRWKGYLKKASELGFRCGAETLTIVRYPFTGELQLYSNVVDEASFIMDAYRQHKQSYFKRFGPEDYDLGLCDLKHLYNGVRDKMQPGRKRTKKVPQVEVRGDELEVSNPLRTKRYGRSALQGTPSAFTFSEEEISAYIDGNNLSIQQEGNVSSNNLALIEGDLARCLLTDSWVADTPRVEFTREDLIQREQSTNISLVDDKQVELETLITTVTQSSIKLRTGIDTLQKYMNEMEEQVPSPAPSLVEQELGPELLEYLNGNVEYLFE